MEFIKVFADDASYKSYRDGKGYVKPNVSLSRDSKKVYYNVDANGHECVDLGLPSGTLWATMNVGAINPVDYGLYFQWGDVKGYTAKQVGTGDGKKKFAWGDYKWNPSGNGATFTKYTTIGMTLELEDDAANKNWGGDWHMPTLDQIMELIINTTSTWTAQNGVSGKTFTSKSDNSKFIFIPAAGAASKGLVRSIGNNGGVWSSTLTNNASDGHYLTINSGRAVAEGNNRSLGFSVRGVIG